MEDAVTVKSSDDKVPIDAMVKRHGCATYIFAASMRDAPAKASRGHPIPKYSAL